jgi:glycosyltransferase involved in cell wall biosynthesis
MDKIQVAIPTYNREVYLSKLVSSIPPGINISVSDNGAFVTDQFKELFKNVKVTSHKEVIGIFDNWNCAAQNTSSEWLVIPSDDDMFFDGAFGKIDHYTKEYPNADILIFGHKTIDENDNTISEWMPLTLDAVNAPLGYDFVKYGVDARMPGIVIKNKLFKQLNGFDNYFTLTSSDSDLVQRALLEGNVVFIPEIIAGYRVWKGNLTSQRVATQHWLDEIDYWQQKIAKLSSEKYAEVGQKIDSAHIADEVFARNLLTGLNNLKGSFKTKFDFFKTSRYPYKASIKTHLRIAKNLFLS